jgi:5,6-dimethylbenzimidazole synthase
VAVLCLGYVREFYPRPMLEMAEWARRFSIETLVHTDYWPDGGDGGVH